MEKTEIIKLDNEEKEKLAWEMICKTEWIDGPIPFVGGIDYIEHFKNGTSIVFHDRGSNRGCDIMVNLMAEKVTRKPWRRETQQWPHNKTQQLSYNNRIIRM